MHRRQALKIFASSALCPLFGSRSFAAESHWGYQGTTGPDSWGALDAANGVCSTGAQQSPVDIVNAVGAQQSSLNIDWSKQPDTVVNNGHTVQLSFADGGGLTVGGRPYRLTQFHFHHPSEHLVNGKGFAMEAHFVHSAVDGELAVIGVFIVPGKTNSVMTKIVATMPVEENSPVPADPAIDPNGLLPVRRDYYHYEGSLTTPPCSETVDWLVFAEPIEAAEADIERFAKLYSMNARPVQDRHRRFILTSGQG
jgi:carbonic anhydrase